VFWLSTKGKHVRLSVAALSIHYHLVFSRRDFAAWATRGRPLSLEDTHLIRNSIQPPICPLSFLLSFKASLRQLTTLSLLLLTSKCWVRTLRCFSQQSLIDWNATLHLLFLLSWSIDTKYEQIPLFSPLVSMMKNNNLTWDNRFSPPTTWREKLKVCFSLATHR